VGPREPAWAGGTSAWRDMQTSIFRVLIFQLFKYR
jgi:hypothetical protein